jgi:hypothetical protein
MRLTRALITAVTVAWGGSTLAYAGDLSMPASPPASNETVAYTNDFNGPVGTKCPEWSLATYSWTANQAEPLAQVCIANS